MAVARAERRAAHPARGGGGLIELKIAYWNYDRTRALLDGSVTIPGVEMIPASDTIVSDIFERMVRGREFDVSELGFTFYLRTLDVDAPFIALPIFPNRFFRHSAVFVNARSGIESPADLTGKTLGELRTYGHDAGVWAKGIFADDYGFAPHRNSWVIGGVLKPEAPHTFIPQPHPAGTDVRDETAKTLDAMLESGEIDALFSAIVPPSILKGSANVRRLFADYEDVERAYYRRTGIFPIMHTVVIRRDLHARHPELAPAIYRAFCEAKEAAVKQYLGATMFHHAPIMVPWFSRLLSEDRRLMGDDWWPYGIAANRTAIETFLRYHYEQGLSKRRLTCEDVFVPELLDT